MIKGNYGTLNIITHLQSVCKSKSELFFFGYKDEADNFRFHSPCTIDQLEELLKNHNLICPNSFFINPYNARRTEKFLTRLYAIQIDLDGWKHKTPLSHLDILDKWHELGFDKPPSIIIRTSEGRFHIILWLQPLAAFLEKKSFWIKCQKGLCELLKEFGTDPQSPVNFVRIPGKINYKYHNKPVVEIVYSSESIFTLSEIHQILIDNEVPKPKRVKTSLLEGITEIEKGVRHGVTNNALYTLSLHYKELGLSKEKAIEKLTSWNIKNELSEVPDKFINTINSAYSSTNKPSPYWINKIINRNNELIEQPIPIKLQHIPRRKKVNTYREKIINYLNDNNRILNLSLRSLADTLKIPREYLRQILKDKKLFTVQITGKGRHVSTTIRLINEKDKHLKLVHSVNENQQDLMTKVNDQNLYVYTEEVRGL